MPRKVCNAGTALRPPPRVPFRANGARACAIPAAPVVLFCEGPADPSRCGPRAERRFPCSSACTTESRGGHDDNDRRKAMTFGQRLSSLEGVLAGDHHRLEQAFQAIAVRACEGDCEDLEADLVGAPGRAARTSGRGRELHHPGAGRRPACGGERSFRRARADPRRAPAPRLRFRPRLLGGEGRPQQFVATLRAHADREEHTFYPWTDCRPGLLPDYRGTAPGFAALGAG